MKRLNPKSLQRAAARAGWQSAGVEGGRGWIKLVGAPPAFLDAPSTARVSVEGRTAAKVLRRLQSPRTWVFNPGDRRDWPMVNVWLDRVQPYELLQHAPTPPAQKLTPCWDARRRLGFGWTQRIEPHHRRCGCAACAQEIAWVLQNQAKCLTNDAAYAATRGEQGESEEYSAKAAELRAEATLWEGVVSAAARTHHANLKKVQEAARC